MSGSSMSTANLQTWDARMLTLEQARNIGELLVRIWPKPNVTVEDRAQQQLAFGRSYLGDDARAPRSLVVLDGGRVIAHALVFARTIRTLEGEMTIAALARVCSDPDRRGEGLGDMVVRAAFAPVDAGDFAFSLFQTSHRVRPFYERLGCVLVDNSITNSLGETPKANPFWDEVVMRYPADRPWPAGTIDLRGPGY
jgi:hypothetical protein